MIAKIYDKLLFVVGLGLLAGSYFVFGRVTPSSDQGSVMRTAEAYTPATFAAPELEKVVWQDAQAQPAGPKWIYDLFTPPLIFLDPNTATLSPEPPKPKIGQEVIGGIQFPFVLVDIARDLYRIQISGFFGQAPDYRVTLEDREQGLPLLGRPGQKWPTSEIELISFNVERRTSNDGGTPIVEEVATAVILDNRTGEQVTLRYPGEPLFLPQPKAEFRTRDEVPINFTLRPGESKKMGDFTYTVREITLDPKEAIVTRDAAGDLPEIRREFRPTPKEELPAEQPPTIQGGAPSNAPFQDRPNSDQPFPFAPPRRL